MKAGAEAGENEMATIRVEATYPQPPERVWFALTDRHALTEWLMPTTDFEARLGHRFQFRVDNPRGWSTVVDCEIVELHPPRRLAYTWKSPIPGTSRQMDTRVTWTLEPAGAGTRLVLEHSGFRSTVSSFMLRNFALRPGWNRMMKTLLPKVLARVHDDGSFVPDPVMAAERCR
jgi:uncharacterized protein YndB with AHSA1/START domain